FSSRRRHTRCYRDWSSDVCSSDLLDNNVQIIAPSLAKIGPLGVPQIELFDLPYIFPNRDLLRLITEGPIGRDLLKKLEPKGVLRSEERRVGKEDGCRVWE